VWHAGHLPTITCQVIKKALRRILDELEANGRSGRTTWATLQRIRKFFEENNSAAIGTPENRFFETEMVQWKFQDWFVVRERASSFGRQADS
jgi:hypothetical protein